MHSPRSIPFSELRKRIFSCFRSSEKRQNRVWAGLLGLLLPLASAESPTGLWLRNGDLLHGTLQEMSETALTFLPAGSDRAVSIPVSELAELRMRAPVAGEMALTHEVHLEAGGRLRGALTGETGDAPALQLPWGQTLTLPQQAVRSTLSLEEVWRAPVEKNLLSILPNGIVFRRPELAEQRIDALHVGRGWRVALPLPHPLPEQFVLELDLSFPDQALAAVSLFTDAETPGNFEGLMLIFRDRKVQLQWLLEGRRVIHAFDLPAAGPLPLRVSLAIDRAAGTLTPGLGGQVQDPLTLPDFNLETPRFMSLNAEPHPLRLHGMRLLPAAADQGAQTAAPREGIAVRSACGDIWVGASAVRLEENHLLASVPGLPEPMRLPMEQLSVLAFAEVQPPAGNLTLRDGGQLHGQIRSLSADRIVVSVPWSETEVALPLTALRAWTADRAAAVDTPPAQELHFTSGEFLSGTLTAMDAETLSLRSVWGQELRFARNQVARLTQAAAQVLQDGLATPEVWNFRSMTLPHRETPPRFEAGWLEFPGLSNQRMSLALPEIPLRFVLEADLEFQTPQPAYRLSLLPFAHSDPQEALFDLSFHGESMLGRQGGPAAMTLNWQEETPNLGHAHALRLFADQQAGRMTLVINGQRIRDWPIVRGDGLGIPDGSFLQIATGPTEPFTVRRLRLLPWNGQVPDLSAADEGPAIVLRNQDVLPLRTLRADAEHLHLTLAAGMEMPVAHRALSELHLQPRQTRAVSLPEGHLRMQSPAAGFALSLRPLSTADGVLTASSPLTDTPLQIPLDLLERLRR